jgi:hypothetical protein
VDAVEVNGYGAPVRRLVAKLVLLTAMLLMPLGMNPVPAAATHDAHASMPMQHCPEQSQKHGGNAGFSECTMVCSAALPAADLAAHAPPMIVCLPVAAAVEQRLHGLHPDTAAPPPKRG